MARAEMTVHLRMRDMMSTKLLILQLQLLESEMRVMASPHAEALTRILDRYLDGPPDDDVPENEGAA